MMNYLPPYYTPSKMISWIRDGIPKPQRPRTVIIAGAGMSGLVAGSLLKQAGHTVKIIEARNRIGGRVYTIRKPFTDGNYFEAGAMRIPNTHFLVFEYIKKFGLEINPFINSTPNDLIYANGVKTRSFFYKKHPDVLRYPVAPGEQGKTDMQLNHSIMNPLIKFLEKDPINNWQFIVPLLEQYSFSTFFRHNPAGPKLSDGAIEMIKVLSIVEGLPELSFLEILREYVILYSKDISFYEIKGGLDRLPKSFIPQLDENIYFNQKLRRIDQTTNQIMFSCLDTKTGQATEVQGDSAIVTLPFTVLQFVDVQPRNSFSHNKWKALRELHYVPSTKIGLQFKDRFWERQGLYGGKTITDLPIRLAHYPSHNFNSKSGVILGSYTWEDDALIWTGKSEQERIHAALTDLAEIHGRNITKEFETGATHSWVLDPYASGAFTLFKPEQETELMPYLSSPEGKVHFAGEHTSLPHGWIQGAIESGIRAAIEVNKG
ncbi:flavin monoamine oxidase family protein [Alkalihalobacillus sp. TS-13]|uniref:flavin monoamine oxidase family protein n=1 Tax=Alkalihalobacillus sp. TS-13 TaxID=2842455 RepID=UPI001C879D70|nr:flavin monoamine oxidase family protein [Alkalihalobacillus sp. TS-13]